MTDVMTRSPLVLATRSSGKIRELTSLCAAEGFATQTLEAAGLPERAEEEGIEVYATFRENAEAKARYFARLLPGRVVLAEDSGLAVDALAGAPGVRSKRWTHSTASGAQLDADNNAALARALQFATNRRARYVCVAVCVVDDAVWHAEGRVEGTIAMAARGAGGFGYDPWFISEELGVTFAEATPEEKSRVSHRARAVRALCADAAAALRARVERVS